MLVAIIAIQFKSLDCDSEIFNGPFIALFPVLNDPQIPEPNISISSLTFIAAPMSYPQLMYL